MKSVHTGHALAVVVRETIQRGHNGEMAPTLPPGLAQQILAGNSTDVLAAIEQMMLDLNRMATPEHVAGSRVMQAGREGRILR